MKASLQIVSTPSLESPDAALALLSFDDRRYFFGHLGESAQRTCVGRRVRLGKLNDIFLSGRPRWPLFGGLPGMMLTMADQGSSRISLHGPRPLAHMLASTRHFIYRANLDVDVHEMGHREVYRDHHFAVCAYHLRRHEQAAEQQQEEEEEEEEHEKHERAEKVHGLIARMFGGEYEKSTERLPPSQPSELATCYRADLHPQRGHFLPRLAQDLGVPRGPAYAQLTRGESVVLADGRVVRPEEVMEPPRRGASFAVIDCPAEAYIPAALQTASLWSVDVVVHILGRGVLQDPRYQHMMAQHPDAKHVVSCPESNGGEIVFQSAAFATVKLNAIDSEIFPLPCHGQASVETGCPGIPARPLLTVDIEPSIRVNQGSVEGRFDLARRQKDTRGMQKLQDAIARIPAAQPRPVPFPFPGSDVEVVALGTGSALPSKYRNVSATLVRMPESSVLLDCGEATLGQLTRLFGDETRRVLAEIRMVFISHLHADHHLGTVELLRSITTISDKDLFVVAPRRFRFFLQELSDVDDFGMGRVSFISCESFNAARNGGSPPSPSSKRTRNGRSDLFTQTGLAVATCYVTHCPDAFGVSIGLANGFKLVYSGDTRPCENLVALGRDATLLIHEATFEDELLDEARAKRHSTTSEAVEVGVRMGAQYTLLTHFSQRYPKVPVFGEDQTVGVAFDGMRVTVGQLPRLATYVEAFKELYHMAEEV